MKTESKIEFLTGNQPERATHIIDDGGIIYWTIAPDLTSDQVAEAFRSGYDGALSNYDVTDIHTGTRTDYTA